MAKQDHVGSKGLMLSDIDSDKKLLLNPDNVFWGILPKSIYSDSFPIPDKLISVYDKMNKGLNAEMDDFRFSANLSAVYVDPTDRCNSNCAYCYVPHNIRRNGTQMTKDQLRTVFQKIESHFKDVPKKPVIIFHASEPLLVKDLIFDAIDEYGKKFLFGIQTNSILLEKPDVEFLKKKRVGVGISLDSVDPEINNRIRPSMEGTNNTANVLRKIEWFDGYEGLNVITTVTGLNVNGLSGLVKALHKRRVSCVLLNPVRVTQKPAWKLIPDMKVLTDSFIDAVETAIELSRRSSHRIIVGNFTNAILAIVAPVARRMMCDISPCGGGRCFLTVTANGNMIPCGEFIGIKGFSGGNIFKSSVSSAMDSAPFKKIRARVVEKIAECDVCDFRNICGAPCPAELHSQGNMYQRSVFCEFYKDVIKYAFKVIADDRVKYVLREEALGSLKYNYRYD